MARNKEQLKTLYREQIGQNGVDYLSRCWGLLKAMGSENNDPCWQALEELAEEYHYDINKSKTLNEIKEDLVEGCKAVREVERIINDEN